MTRFALPGLLVVASAFLLASPVRADNAAKAEKERKEVRKKAQATLGRLYKAQPAAKVAVEKAAGYAVFNNASTKILVAGGGKGQGIAVDNQSRKETFMKMLEVQAGLGFGVKKFSLVWVFESPAALANFINGGMELGGQTSAAAKAGESGGSLSGAVQVTDGVWVYQLTDAGLALELTVKGTKYKVDDDLNK